MTGARFATTHWSLIFSARAGEDDALAQFCRGYWYPLYAFARRSGADATTAEDRVQSFFAHLLSERERIAPDPTRGRFRSWIITSFKNHVAQLREKEGAIKRGGRMKQLHFDLREAESWLEAEGREESPERSFERAWAESVIRSARERLKRAQEAAGKSEIHDRLEEALGNLEPRGGHRSAAEDLGLSEGALRVALHRLRRAFGDALREVVAETLGPDDRIDDEVAALIAAMTPEKKLSDSR